MGQEKSLCVVTWSPVTSEARLPSLKQLRAPRGPRPSAALRSGAPGSCPAGPAEARDPYAAPRVFSLQGMGFPNLQASVVP